MAKVTVSTAVLIEKFGEDFFVEASGEHFSLLFAETDEGETVELEVVGYIGKDCDGFDRWQINGVTEGATLIGTWYNERKFESAKRELGL